MNRMKRRFAFLSVMGLVGGLSSLPAWGITATWTLTTAGPHSWNVNTNPPWNTASFPNAVDDVANLNINIAANQTVNLNQAITLGTLNFGDTSSNQQQTIAPNGGSLTFDVSAGNATLTKDAGGTGVATISAGITLNDNLIVTNNSTGNLYLRGGINTNVSNITFDGSGWTRLQDAGAGISGSGNVIKNGSGALLLGNGGTNPTHTYTGTTTVNGGTIMFQAANKAAGNFRLNNGMLTDYYRNTTIFSGGLGTGNNQIQIYGDSGFGGGNGNSNWRIGAQNSVLQWGSTFFNPTSLKFLVPGVDNMGPSIYGQVTLQNGLNLNGGARTIFVAPATGANIVNSFGKIDGVISDSVGGGSIIKTGGGQLVLNAVNTFAGGVDITAGRIQVGNASALGNGGPVSFTGAGTILDLRSNLNIGNLSGTANNGLITAGAAGARILTVNQTGNTTFGGVIENGLGTVSFVKNGAGALTLNGINTYTGATTINGGALIVNGSLSAASAIAINNATLGGNGTINGALTLNALSDVLSPGNSAGITSFGSSQTWSSYTYEWEINNWAGTTAGTDFDQVAIAGSLDLSATAANSYLLNLLSLTAGDATGDVFNFAETGGSWSILTATGGITGFDPLEWQINASGFTNNELGTWSLGLGNQNNDLVLTYTAAASAVPEPATATLGLLAVTGLMMRRRRA